MAWISIVAARPRFQAQIAERRAMRAASGVTAFNVLNTLVAWLGGDEEAIRDEEQILTHPTHLPPKMVARPSDTLLLTLSASLLVRRAAGEDVDAELERLSSLKGYKEKAALIVQGALARIVAGKVAKAGALNEREIGYPDTDADFKKLADRAPAIGAKLALVPDGPLWGRLFGTSVPLAYEAMLSSGRAPDLAALRAFLRAGADSRARDVVYERAGEASTGVWRDDASAVPGFDAVELAADAVIVHHYMGVRWQAPLLLDEQVDAFRFLAHAGAGWADVQKRVDGATWRRIEKARTAHRTVHRVSIDPENAMEDAASTERARKRYGVEIEVTGFLAA